MNSPENSGETKKGLVSRIGIKGVGAAAVALVFGLDSALVLTAPLVHAVGAGELSDAHPEYLAVAGVEAAIAVGAGMYALKRARQQG